MTIVFNSHVSALKETLRIIACVAPKKSTVNVLECIRFEGNTATASDLDVNVTRDCEHTTADSVIVVNAGKLTKFIAGADKGARVTGTLNEGRVTFTCEGMHGTFDALDAADWPVYLAKPMAHSFSLQATELRTALTSLMYSASKEETRYYLQGAYITEEMGALTMVTTDGHRLTRLKFTDTYAGESVIYPRDTMAVLLKIMGAKPKGAARMGVSECGLRVSVELDGVTLESRVIDAQFPDYTRVIAAKSYNTITADIADMKAKAKRMASLGVRAINISTSGDLTSESDGDKYAAKIKSRADGEPQSVGVKADYIADICGSFAQYGDSVTLDISSPANPIRVTADTTGPFEIDMTQMPMRY